MNNCWVHDGAPRRPCHCIEDHKALQQLLKMHATKASDEDTERDDNDGAGVDRVDGPPLPKLRTCPKCGTSLWVQTASVNVEGLDEWTLNDSCPECEWAPGRVASPPAQAFAKHCDHVWEHPEFWRGWVRCEKCGTMKAEKSEQMFPPVKASECDAGPCTRPEVGDIPLAEQIRNLQALIDRGPTVLCEFIREHWHPIAFSARERCTEGYKGYGSQMYRWEHDERRQNEIEEAADLLVYMSSEGAEGL